MTLSRASHSDHDALPARDRAHPLPKAAREEGVERVEGVEGTFRLVEIDAERPHVETEERLERERGQARVGQVPRGAAQRRRGDERGGQALDREARSRCHRRILSAPPPFSSLPGGAGSCDPRSMAPLSGPPAYVVREVGSETIVYDPRTHQAHCLGPEAAAVWRECDGQRSAAEISERVRLRGGETIDEASVAVALRRLGRAGLLERPARASGRPKASGPGPSAGRRAALRRVAALAGLTVASLIVPTPEAAAATCTPNQVLGDGGASRCTSSSECCSRCCVTTVFFGNRCRPTGSSGTCLL